MIKQDEWVSVTKKEPDDGQLALFAFGTVRDGFVSVSVGRWDAENLWARNGLGSYFYYPDEESGARLYWAPFEWPEAKE